MAVAPATRALAALTLLLAGPAQAGRFQHDLSAGLSLEYDTNPSLAASGGDGLWRLAATPGYQLTGADGTDQWHARGGLRLERSTDAAVSADRQDPTLSLSWTRQLPTSQFSLAGSYEQASTRVTEFQDSGRVSADGTRTAQSLSASWLGELDPLDSLSLTGSYADTRYSGGGLSDYANLNLGATWTRAWNERASAYLRLSASRYLPGAASAASSDSFDALAGLSLARSERFNLDLRAGFNRTSSGGGNGGWQGGATLGYDYAPRARLALELSRSTASSGAGGFITTDRFDGHWNLALSERDSAGVDLSWNRGGSATTASATTTRQFQLWASRALSPAWGLRLFYQYKQRAGAGQAAADAQVLGLALSYAHPDFPLL